MAKSNQTGNTRSNSVDVSPPESNGVIAAWRGLYHALGARAEAFDLTSDGLVIRGFSVNGAYDPQKIISDVNHKNHRVSLFPTILWIQGQEPEPFETAQEMTSYSVQNFRGSVETGATRTPEYVRDAFKALKGRMGISNKRGPKPRTISLKNLSTLDASVLTNAKVPASDLQKLIEVASAALADAPAEAPETSEVAATS
jgi:hypothetical protein